MSSCRDPSKSLNGIQGGGELDGQELDLILKSLEEMEYKFQATFQRMDNAIAGIHGQFNKDNGRYNELVDEIFDNFKRFEDRIIYEIRKSKEQGFVPEPFWGGAPSRQIMKDSVACQDIDQLCKLDTKQKPSNSELLKNIKAKTEKLEKMTDDKFNSVFNAFRQLKEKSQRHAEEQKKLKENVEKRFRDHEEFIRTHLLNLRVV